MCTWSVGQSPTIRPANEDDSTHIPRQADFEASALAQGYGYKEISLADQDSIYGTESVCIREQQPMHIVLHRTLFHGQDAIRKLSCYLCLPSSGTIFVASRPGLVVPENIDRMGRRNTKTVHHGGNRFVTNR